VNTVMNESLGLKNCGKNALQSDDLICTKFSRKTLLRGISPGKYVTLCTLRHLLVLHTL